MTSDRRFEGSGSGAAAKRFDAPGAALVKRNRRWLALGASPFLAAFGLLVAAIVTGMWPIAFPCFHLSLFGALGLSWTYRNNRNPSHVPGGIAVDEEGVRHAGRLLARRDEIKGGFLLPRDDGMYLRLERRGARPSILARVRDADEGRAALRALGLDATQTAGTLDVASQLFAWSLGKQLAVLLPSIFVGVGLIQALAIGIGGVAAIVGVPILVTMILAWVFGLIFAPTRVRFGVDGIATRWLGRDRFYPLSEVESAQRYEENVGGKTYVGVELALAGGGRAKIPGGQKGWSRVDPREIEERVREVLELHRNGPSEIDPALLARGERSVTEWIARLRAIGAGANADARTAALPPEKLLSVVEDATASPAARVGAAVAAIPQLPAEARRRVRVAAATSASPALRVALTRVTEADDDEALAEALAELEDDDPRAASGRR